MFLRLLLTVFLEKIINTFIYDPIALKELRKKLCDKVISILLTDINVNIIIIFSKDKINILYSWNKNIDCLIELETQMLLTLKDYKRIIKLIHNGDIKVLGNITVIYNLIMLFNVAKFDMFELLVPYIGDLGTACFNKIFIKYINFLSKKINIYKKYIMETLTEEWCLVPGALEVNWFIQEIDNVKHNINKLINRIEKLENI